MIQTIVLNMRLNPAVPQYRKPLISVVAWPTIDDTDATRFPNLNSELQKLNSINQIYIEVRSNFNPSAVEPLLLRLVSRFC